MVIKAILKVLIDALQLFFLFTLILVVIGWEYFEQAVIDHKVCFLGFLTIGRPCTITWYGVITWDFVYLAPTIFHVYLFLTIQIWFVDFCGQNGFWRIFLIFCFHIFIVWFQVRKSWLVPQNPYFLWWWFYHFLLF